MCNFFRFNFYGKPTSLENKIENLTCLRFDRNTVSVSQDVKDEMLRLRTYCQHKISYTHFLEPKGKTDFSTRVLFHNISSLHCHFDDVRCDPNYLNADIVGIAESRLISTDADVTYSLESHGFQRIIRNDQPQPLNNDQPQPSHTTVGKGVHATTKKRPPHGIAIYLKKTFGLLSEIHYQTDQIEYSLISVVNKHVPHRLMQFAIVYKSPTCNAGLLHHAMEILKSQTDPGYPLSVLGDFNTDPMRTPKVIAKIEAILKCSQLQTEYTYIPNDDEKSRIDLLFTDADSPKVGVIESLISNHRIITLVC